MRAFSRNEGRLPLIRAREIPSFRWDGGVLEGSPLVIILLMSG